MKERGVLGKDVDSITILGRVLRRTPEGYELEGDPKHANLIVERLDLKAEFQRCNNPWDEAEGRRRRSTLVGRCRNSVSFRDNASRVFVIGQTGFMLCCQRIGTRNVLADRPRPGGATSSRSLPGEATTRGPTLLLAVPT